MKTVTFYQPFLNERGTCVAMVRWAHYNQTLLGNKSIFLYDSLDTRNVKDYIKELKKTFEVYDFKCGNCSVEERMKLIDDILEQNNSKYLHISKLGINDGVFSKKVKTIISAAGMIHPDQAHGDVFTYVSYWSSNMCSSGKYPALPYIVELPNENGNLRHQLGISNEAIVFGRHGGEDTFDMPWAYSVISEALDQKENIYFLFLNTKKFIEHDRVIFLDRIIDENHKTKFINSCDAMLHVRFIGETFGMACGEFSIRNKPVITWYNSRERNHIDILQDKGIYYSTPQDLLDILVSFTSLSDKDWNAYREYNPENMMQIFQNLLLD